MPGSAIPILGALFKSKSFEKRETELVFFCTTTIVKPVNRDDLPATRGLDGLKKGSPLGVEPQGEGIKGASGYSTGTDGAKATNATEANAASTNANNSNASRRPPPPAADSRARGESGGDAREG